MYFSSVFGTMTVSVLVVETSAFTNRALPWSRRNSTLFLAFPRRKFLPVIVILVPTEAILGVTVLITGVLVFASATAGTKSAPSAAATTVRRSWRRVRDRRAIAPGIGHLPCRLESPVVGGRPYSTVRSSFVVFERTSRPSSV